MVSPTFATRPQVRNQLRSIQFEAKTDRSRVRMSPLRGADGSPHLMGDGPRSFQVILASGAKPGQLLGARKMGPPGCRRARPNVDWLRMPITRSWPAGWLTTCCPWDWTDRPSRGACRKARGPMGLWLNGFGCGLRPRRITVDRACAPACLRQAGFLLRLKVIKHSPAPTCWRSAVVHCAGSDGRPRRAGW